MTLSAKAAPTQKAALKTSCTGPQAARSMEEDDGEGPCRAYVISWCDGMGGAAAAVKHCTTHISGQAVEQEKNLLDFTLATHPELESASRIEDFDVEATIARIGDTKPDVVFFVIGLPLFCFLFFSSSLSSTLRL